ncbi:MAG: hypothetical protein R3C44_13555 [Chloroflexota bacterium]
MTITLTITVLDVTKLEPLTTPTPVPEAAVPNHERLHRQVGL